MKTSFNFRSFYKLRKSVTQEVERLEEPLRLRRKRLSAGLIRAIPRSLSHYAQKVNLVNRLLDDGVCYLQIYYENSAARCAFKNRKAVLKAFGELKRAWKDSVVVKFSPPRPFRSRFRAMPNDVEIEIRVK